MYSTTACASSANLGPGFDHLSIAISSYHESLDLERTSESSFDSVILTDAFDNVIHSAPSIEIVKTMLSDFGIKDHVRLRTAGNIPWGAGLGSSGASSVSAVMAVDREFYLSLGLDQMVYYSMLGEEYVAGARHADNVIASLMGDLNVIVARSPLKSRRFRISPSLKLFLITPSLFIQNKTRESRKLLNREVSIPDASENARNLAILLHGLITADIELIREGMNDIVVEPLRSSLFPFYGPLKSELRKRAGVGVALSGGGPSVLCVGSEESDIKEIRECASSVLGNIGLAFNVIETTTCSGGLNERRNYLFE